MNIRLDVFVISSLLLQLLTRLDLWNTNGMKSLRNGIITIVANSFSHHMWTNDATLFMNQLPFIVGIPVV